VHDAGTVGGAQRPQQGEADRGGAHGVERAVGGQDVVQRPGLHELHDDPGAAVGFEDVVDAHHTRVVQPGRGPRLAQGAAAQLVTLGGQELGGRDDLLDGDIAAERLIPRMPDPPHAANAQCLDQAVAAGDKSRRSGHRDEVTHPGSK
jgi:hypothetical protein